MNDKINLITTPVFYANGQPHLGNIYTIVLADIFKKYLYLHNINSFLVTGLDEHGQKIEKGNLEALKNIEQYLRDLRLQYKQILKWLAIDYDYFVYTSSDQHKQYVTKQIDLLYHREFIYHDEYEGYYSIQDETFLTPREVIFKNNQYFSIKDKYRVERIKESAYFLKTKQFFPYIKKTLKIPSTLQPKQKVKEMLNIIADKEFSNLCISRSSLDVRGIELPFDKKNKLYVWVDALYSYYSALDYCFDKKIKFKQVNSFHIIGKEITKFHSIYLPIIMKMSDIKVASFSLYSHQWILIKGEKMSKSKGNIISALKLRKMLKTDELRYYLFKNGPVQNDALLSITDAHELIRTDLINKYGNLCYRTTRMIKNYNIDVWGNFEIKKLLVNHAKFVKIINSILSQVFHARNKKKLIHLFNNLHAIRKKVIELIDMGNSLLSIAEPWNLFKKNREEQGEQILFLGLLFIIIFSFLIRPVITDTTKKVFKSLNLNFTQIKYIWNKSKNEEEFIRKVGSLIKGMCGAKKITPIKIFNKGE